MSRVQLTVVLYTIYGIKRNMSKIKDYRVKRKTKRTEGF